MSAGAPHVADRLEAERHVLAGREAQRLERDLHLDVVAVPGHAPARGVLEVGRHVAVAAFLVHAVHLDADRVGAEEERLLLVVVGVDRDTDPVALPHLIAGHDRRLHVAGIVARVERDIEVLVVVHHHRQRAERVANALDRTAVGERVEHGGHRPDLVVEHAVDVRALGHARRRDADLPTGAERAERSAFPGRGRDRARLRGLADRRERHQHARRAGRRDGGRSGDGNGGGRSHREDGEQESEAFHGGSPGS